MAQKREKDETLELKVPAESALTMACPDNSCKSLPTSTTNASTSSTFNVGRVDRRETTPSRSHDSNPATHDRKRPSGLQLPKRPVNRCSRCTKRVGLTGFSCRCGHLFCALHRYSDRHHCPFDYKSAGRAAIAKDNPLVRAPKLQKV